jgi:hypothetical protein
MCKWPLKMGLLIAALGIAQTSAAANSILAGHFEGSEPILDVVWPGYVAGLQFATRQISFNVSVSGSYRLEDVYEHWYFNHEGSPGLDVIAALYQGSFDPQNPALHRLGPDQYGAWPRQLEAGVEYTLVLQKTSQNLKGVWTVVINGPGEVNSTARRSGPNLGQGKFIGTEAKSSSQCSEVAAFYQVQGPFQVSRDGFHYFTNMSHLSTATATFSSSDLCFGVYSAPPDVSQPELNLLGYLNHNLGKYDLQAGTDYYLLVQSIENKLMDYFLVIAPPAPFEINPWMSGLWADLETDGQGLMLNVYPSIDAVHLAWFTYDLERPPNSALAQIGEPGHRWLTAFGGLAGADSEMTITRTSGGVFDAIQPVPAQIQDGSVQLHFDSCTSGTLNYDLGSAQSTGQLILRRPYEDRANIDRCLLANRGPGIPGPL